jgi:hypothetical protein
MSVAIPPLPNTPSWGGAQLKKHREFTFYSNLYYYYYYYYYHHHHHHEGEDQG